MGPYLACRGPTISNNCSKLVQSAQNELFFFFWCTSNQQTFGTYFVENMPVPQKIALKKAGSLACL